MNAHIDVKHLLPVWEQFRAVTDIAPIRDEAHYARMTEMLEACWMKPRATKPIPPRDWSTSWAI